MLIRRSPKGFALRAALGVAALGATLGFAADAIRTVYVNAAALDVKAKNRVVSKVVTTVERGAELEVIEEAGRWLKVRVDGKEGYVAESAVSNDPVGESAGVTGDFSGRPGELENAAAAKGLNEMAREYADSKGYDTGPVDRMIDFGQEVSRDEEAYEEFTREGKVGPYKPRR